jgi:hypothetical protein
MAAVAGDQRAVAEIGRIQAVRSEAKQADRWRNIYELGSWTWFERKAFEDIVFTSETEVGNLFNDEAGLYEAGTMRTIKIPVMIPGVQQGKSDDIVFDHEWLSLHLPLGLMHPDLVYSFTGFRILQKKTRCIVDCTFPPREHHGREDEEPPLFRIGPEAPIWQPDGLGITFAIKHQGQAVKAEVYVAITAGQFPCRLFGTPEHSAYTIPIQRALQILGVRQTVTDEGDFVITMHLRQRTTEIWIGDAQVKLRRIASPAAVSKRKDTAKQPKTLAQLQLGAEEEAADEDKQEVEEEGEYMQHHGERVLGTGDAEKEKRYVFYEFEEDSPTTVTFQVWRVPADSDGEAEAVNIGLLGLMASQPLIRL